MPGFHDCHCFGDGGGHGGLRCSALCLAALDRIITLLVCVGVPRFVQRFLWLLLLIAWGFLLIACSSSSVIHDFDPAKVHCAPLVVPDTIAPCLDCCNATCLVFFTLLLLFDLAQAIVASLINLVYAGLDGAHCVDLFLFKIEVRICQFLLSPDSDRLCF